MNLLCSISLSWTFVFNTDGEVCRIMLQIPHTGSYFPILTGKIFLQVFECSQDNAKLTLRFLIESCLIFPILEHRGAISNTEEKKYK